MVFGRSINESNFFGGFTINMSTIIILIFDLYSWPLKFSDIHSSGTSEFPYYLCQLLQIIGQVMACFKFLIELCNLILLILLQLRLLFSLCLLLLNKKSVFFLQFSNSTVSLDLLNNNNYYKTYSLLGPLGLDLA